jgi:hypothetical protein
VASGALDAKYRFMVTADAVTIVVNGTIVTSSAPARIRAGRVVAPLTPIVVRLVARAAYEPATATVAVERSGTRVVVPVAFVENGIPYVELGAVVRGIGGSAVFDTATKTLTVLVGPAPAIATPAPFDPTLPRVAPTTVFTPSPPPPTPRSTDSGAPHPRRTAIPVLPSQPIVPSEAAPTSRRR